MAVPLVRTRVRLARGVRPPARAGLLVAREPARAQPAARTWAVRARAPELALERAARPAPAWAAVVRPSGPARLGHLVPLARRGPRPARRARAAARERVQAARERVQAARERVQAARERV